MYIHAPLGIEDVAVWLEAVWDVSVLKIKQCGESHPHVATLAGYRRVAIGAADLARKLMLWAPVLSV